jgi:hypothetical protein
MMALQFVDRQIITPEVLPRCACIESALRLRNSAIIELRLLAVIFAAGNFWWKGALAIPVKHLVRHGDCRRKRVGACRLLVRVCQSAHYPVHRAALVFPATHLEKVAVASLQEDLNLVPIHPDSCCGLGFSRTNPVRTGAIPAGAQRPAGRICRPHSLPRCQIDGTEDGDRGRGTVPVLACLGAALRIRAAVASPAPTQRVQVRFAGQRVCDRIRQEMDRGPAAH